MADGASTLIPLTDSKGAAWSGNPIGIKEAGLSGYSLIVETVGKKGTSYEEYDVSADGAVGKKGTKLTSLDLVGREGSYDADLNQDNQIGLIPSGARSDYGSGDVEVYTIPAVGHGILADGASTLIPLTDSKGAAWSGNPIGVNTTASGYELILETAGKKGTSYSEISVTSNGEVGKKGSTLTSLQLIGEEVTYGADLNQDGEIGLLPAGTRADYGTGSSGYVIVWQSWEQDGSDFGIYGQIYNSDGTRQGSEFQVNTHTENSQGDPFVFSSNNGGFHVVWESEVQDGDTRDVYAQAFTGEGIKNGPERLVNTYTESNQDDAAGASLRDGGSVIIWESSNQDGSGDGIFGQIYNLDGTSRGSEFQLNTYTNSGQSEPFVFSSNNGGFYVVWDSDDQDGSEEGIYGQAFNANGTALGPWERLVNTFTESDQSQPSGVALNDGGIVVVWESLHQDGSESGIFGQIYNSDGTSRGSEFQVNTYTNDWQMRPSVAVTDLGFGVIWESWEQDGEEYGIYGQGFTAAGGRLGSETQLSNGTDGNQEFGVIATLSQGGNVVAWHSSEQIDGEEQSFNTFAQVFNADGTSRVDDLRVNTFIEGAQVVASVASLVDTNPKIYEIFGVGHGILADGATYLTPLTDSKGKAWSGNPIGIKEEGLSGYSLITETVSKKGTSYSEISISSDGEVAKKGTPLKFEDLIKLEDEYKADLNQDGEIGLNSVESSVATDVLSGGLDQLF